MQFLEDMLINPLLVLKRHLLGRGILSLGVIVAGSMGGITPALVIGIGGALLTGFMRLGNQGLYEEQMVNLYRDDIAEHLGIAPEQVIRAHLKEAAKTNDIIDQALDRQRYKNYITFATAALAGAATVALVALGLPESIAGVFTQLFGKESTVGTVLGYFSTAIVSGLSSLIVHDGLELLIGHKTGVRKAAAHDRIIELDHAIARGQAVNKEQVYGVLVAGNTELQQTITREFGKDYARMTPLEQRYVLQEIGVGDAMQTLAQDISQGKVQPGKLAYMISDAQPRRRATPEKDAPALAPTRSFVQSLGLTPRETMSHEARLGASRTLATERTV